QQKLSWGADHCGDRQQQRERNDDVIGDALRETERAGRKFEPILEEPGAGERGGADHEDGNCRGGGRFGPSAVEEVLPPDCGCHPASIALAVMRLNPGRLRQFAGSPWAMRSMVACTVTAPLPPRNCAVLPPR